MLVEGTGKPLAVRLTPGQAPEVGQVDELLDSVRIGGKPGPPRRRLDVVAGDKGYDSLESRAHICARGSKPLVAHRKRRDGSYPPEAAGFDKELYKRRNVIERLIGRLKEWRRIATRFEKLKKNFLAMIQLASIKIWLKPLLSDTA